MSIFIPCECGYEIEINENTKEKTIFCECCGYDCLNVQEKINGNGEDDLNV